MIQIRLKFDLNDGELEEIREAERILRELGMSFESGEYITPEPGHVRQWYLDDRVEGVMVCESRLLAILAHRLWTHWSQHIAEEEDISEERLERWQGLWVPFEQLSDEMQDKDYDLVKRFLNTTPDFTNKEGESSE